MSKLKIYLLGNLERTFSRNDKRILEIKTIQFYFFWIMTAEWIQYGNQDEIINHNHQPNCLLPPW